MKTPKPFAVWLIHEDIYWDTKFDLFAFLVERVGVMPDHMEFAKPPPCIDPRFVAVAVRPV